MTELIICEKPKSAFKIAQALADDKPEKESNQQVPYYKLKHTGKDIIVSCAVGHLYGLAEKIKNGWGYPIFDIEWKPVYETNKEAGYSKKYAQAIKKLAKEAQQFTVATDYDVEGEVIGLNVIRFLCNQKDASRMKFSTLTKQELVHAYETKNNHLDWGQANAGEARHYLDFYYGINLSRALTSSIKAAGAFKVMSTGRVQGPALKLIVDREKEIRTFKPVPFWQIEMLGKTKQAQKPDITAWHKQDKFWKKEEAERIYNKVKNEKKAKIAEIKRTKFKQMPPNPFDLTAMQVEAYRCFKISPKETLSLAQNLYLAGLISYPRTSSNQLPPSLEYRKIISALAAQKEYRKLCEVLLAKTDLFPNNGKKTDPAHPALYPTGEIPKKISERERKIYDLIVRRTLASFGDLAERETMQIDINCKEEIFIAKGTRTIAKGWHIFYEPYLKLQEEELPNVKKDEEIDVKKITLHQKETQPPGRYTQASIIKELEKRGLGTKATRAEIIDTLYQRGFITGKAIMATDLGIRLVDTLQKYCPRILDEALTRHFEKEMEGIRTAKKKPEAVLAEAKEILLKILNEFRTNEQAIGKELLAAQRETQRKEETIGICPICGKGQLMVRRGKFGRFIACNHYPECSTTFKLPPAGLVKTAEKLCPECNHPMVMVIRKARKPQELCINPKCPSKAVSKAVEKQKKKCPKCGKPLVLRSSVYGKFWGCSGYPQCRHIEKVRK